MSLTIESKPATDNGGHWYSSTGESCHDADLRRARKEGLLPSVTSVMQIKSKPALDAWKQQQVILAALTLPRLPSETADDYAARVVQDWKAQSSQAAATGTAVHAYAEGCILGTNPAPVPGLEPLCEKVRAWIEDNLGEGQPEQVMINESLGYAGRIDWTGGLKKDDRLAIVDFKTQAVKPGRKPTFYDEWIAQLTAYGEGAKDITYISVILSTNPQAPEVVPYTWTAEEAETGWKVFRHCLALWQLDRGYFPGVAK